MIDSDSQKIKEIINSRFVDKIYPSKEDLEKILKSGKKLTIYIGIDPTAVSLHLGHSTNFLFLKKLKELGHKIIILIGDFTAQIGDPTDKLATRKSLTEKQVLDNCKTYKDQISKTLSFDPKKNGAEIRFNSQWLDKLTLKDLIKLTANFTVNQIFQRDMFQKRLKDGKEIYLHEFFYPLIQGYDSVAMDIDIEVGGTDQTFNMFIGRDLMKIYKNKEKIVITTPLLINPKTGKKLMSKSEGNYVGLDNSAEEMFGKIMALPDEAILPCFEFCTDLPQEQIEEIKKSLASNKVNPRDLKAKLGFEIVSFYHGEEQAEKVRKEFDSVFKEGNLPSEMPEIKVSDKTIDIIDFLAGNNLIASKSEVRRLVEQKGVKIDNAVVENWKEKIEIKNGSVIQIGKRKFIKIKCS